MLRFFLALITSVVGLVLVLPAVALLIPVWIVNSMVSLIAALLQRRARPWDQILHFEPGIGWRPNANLDLHYSDRIGDRCHIQTDAEGWPGRYTIEASDVVVFGDSFAFGYGVSARHAYYSLGRDCRIKAVGAPGYTMVQQVMLLREYASRLHGKLVVWFICLENDLAENLKVHQHDLYTTPFLRTNNGPDQWEIVRDHVQSSRWRLGDQLTENLSEFAYICTPCPYSDRVFSGARHLIREGRELCAGAGADLMVFTIPYYLQLSEEGQLVLTSRLKHPENFDPAYPDRQLAAICEQLEVPFLAGMQHLTRADYKLRDGHWNRRGNRRVAELIESHLGQRRASSLGMNPALAVR